MTLLMDERIERPRSLFGPGARDRVGVSGEPTLDDVVVRAWEGLTAHAAATCPICEGPLRPRRAAVVGGRCERCDTTLD